MRATLILIVSLLTLVVSPLKAQDSSYFEPQLVFQVQDSFVTVSVYGENTPIKIFSFSELKQQMYQHQIATPEDKIVWEDSSLYINAVLVSQLNGAAVISREGKSLVAHYDKARGFYWELQYACQIEVSSNSQTVTVNCQLSQSNRTTQFTKLAFMNWLIQNQVFAPGTRIYIMPGDQGLAFDEQKYLKTTLKALPGTNANPVLATSSGASSIVVVCTESGTLKVFKSNG